MIAFLLALLPSFLHVPLRRMMGAQIGKGSRIRIGTVIRARTIVIGEHSSIGPFCMMRARELHIGSHSSVKPITLTSAKKVSIGSYVQIAPLAMISGDWTPRSSFEIGDHSRVFPFCWLDTGEGIKIGRQVGLGGHTLIFTHGVWTNYLDGGPVSYGGVELEDNVWLPWRVFIMPGVKVGKWSIIGANSLVNKSIPENSVVAGAPAKVVKENVIQEPDTAEKQKRAQRMLDDFAAYDDEKPWTKESGRITRGTEVISLNPEEQDPNALLLLTDEIPGIEELLQTRYKNRNIIYHPTKTAYIRKHSDTTTHFISFLRRYGIRLYINS